MTMGDRVYDSLSVRIGLYVRSAIPGLLLFALVFVSVLPLRLPAYATVAPLLPLMALYYWAVHRPDLLPSSLMFVLGIVQDVLMGAPMGLHAFIFMLFHWVVASQRRFLIGRSFWVLWWGFLIVLPLAAILEWVLYSAISGNILPVEPAVFRALIMMGGFPAIAWVCIQFHRLVAQ